MMKMWCVVEFDLNIHGEVQWVKAVHGPFLSDTRAIDFKAEHHSETTPMWITEITADPNPNSIKTMEHIGPIDAG